MALALEKTYLVGLLLLLLLCLFSKFSEGSGKSAVHGEKQLMRVLDAISARAEFSTQASLQDASGALALLHACEAFAHASAAKDLCDRCGLPPRTGLLTLREDAQDRIDELLLELDRPFELSA